MAKIKSVKSNTEVYAEIIADIASRAAAEIEGAELLGKNPTSRVSSKTTTSTLTLKATTPSISIFI